MDKAIFVQNLEKVQDMLDNSTFLALKNAGSEEELKKIIEKELSKKYNVALDWLYSTLPSQQLTAADYWDGDESVLM